MTDYKAVVAEIRQRVIDGTLARDDIEKAQDVYEYARELWDQHTWLRALGGWRAEIDAYAINFLRREIEIEE